GEEPAVAARAVEALARLYTSRGLREDAAYCYRLLGTDYARVRLPVGKTGAELFNEAATDKRLLPFLDPPPQLPVGRLTATDESASSPPSQQPFPFAKAAEPLPYFRRHAFVLVFNNLNQLKVLDVRTGHETWTQQLAPSVSTFQYIVQQVGSQPGN